MHNIEVITIENTHTRARFLNYGATLYSFEVLENGEYVNKIITLDLEDYIDNGLYCGAICGPTAGRIKNATYELNGVVKLSKNSDPHHLHGGLDSYARKYFDYEVYEDSVVFKYITKNVEYPGTQHIQITYKLIDTSLEIIFEADTDVDIPMNITSHIYFSAFENESVLDNKMRLPSTKRIELVNYAPEKVIDDNSYIALNKVKLLDDPFILDEGIITYESDKYRLDVETDYDAVVIYTQNYSDSSLPYENKGICFETQKWPNGINIEGYEAVLKAGEHYRYKTIYKFSNK